ncbi:MAG: hypothetical protein ABI343_09730 [Burkholderiaceae bacterium]
MSRDRPLLRLLRVPLPRRRKHLGARAGAGLAIVGSLLLSGCAGPLVLFGMGGDTLFRDPDLSAQAANATIVLGSTTRAQVRAALGETRMVHFESGYEVWAYRGRSVGSAVPGKTEFVVLFDPSGIVQKTRVRLPGAAGDGQ